MFDANDGTGNPLHCLRGSHAVFSRDQPVFLRSLILLSVICNNIVSEITHLFWTIFPLEYLKLTRQGVFNGDIVLFGVQNKGFVLYLMTFTSGFWSGAIFTIIGLSCINVPNCFLLRLEIFQRFSTHQVMDF